MPKKYPQPAAELTFAQPFRTTREAWIWAAQAMEYRLNGAKIKAGCSDIMRPCDPHDIMVTVGRLLRIGAMKQFHIHTMVQVARSFLFPCNQSFFPTTEQEKIWEEAMEILSKPLIDKGIVNLGGGK